MLHAYLIIPVRINTKVTIFYYLHGLHKVNIKTIYSWWKRGGREGRRETAICMPVVKTDPSVLYRLLAISHHTHTHTHMHIQCTHTHIQPYTSSLSPKEELLHSPLWLHFCDISSSPKSSLTLILDPGSTLKYWRQKELSAHTPSKSLERPSKRPCDTLEKGPLLGGGRWSVWRGHGWAPTLRVLPVFEVTLPQWPQASLCDQGTEIRQL